MTNVLTHESGIQVTLVKKTKNIIAEAPPISTFILRFPRYILAQLSKHRMFSFNSESSRAIKVPKMIDRMRDRRFYPISLGKANKGMTNGGEHNGLIKMLGSGRLPYDIFTKEQLWDAQWTNAVFAAQAFDEAGYHQEIPNRLLEPFMMIEIILTATDFQGFYAQRCADDAQAEIAVLANLMRGLDVNTPAELPIVIGNTSYHLPMVSAHEIIGLTAAEALKINAARCCVVSYSNHKGTTIMLEQAEKLMKKLLPEDGVPHLSVFEHAARCLTTEEYIGILKVQDKFRGLIPFLKEGMVKKKIKQVQYFGNKNLWLDQRFEMEMSNG